MKEQCFFIRDVKRGKGVAALSQERRDVPQGTGRRWWMEEDGSQTSRKKSLESLSRLASNEVSSAAKRTQE